MEKRKEKIEKNSLLSIGFFAFLFLFFFTHAPIEDDSQQSSFRNALGKQLFSFLDDGINSYIDAGNQTAFRIAIRLDWGTNAVANALVGSTLFVVHISLTQYHVIENTMAALLDALESTSQLLAGD